MPVMMVELARQLVNRQRELVRQWGVEQAEELFEVRVRSGFGQPEVVSRDLVTKKQQPVLVAASCWLMM